MIVLKGTGVSPGIAVGKVLLIHKPECNVRRHNITKVEEEVQRLSAAVVMAKSELGNFYRNVKEKIGEKEANILLGQISILEDMDFIGYMGDEIRTGKINAEWAVENTRDYFVSLFLSMNTERMKERAADIKDIANRVLNSFEGINHEERLPLMSDEVEVIVASKDLAPSDVLQMDAAKVKGILLEMGGKTSHAAILAQSMGIPVLVRIAGLTEQIRTGDYAAFDGEDGNLYLNPDEEILRSFNIRQKGNTKDKLKLLSLKDAVSQTQTMDGHGMEIAANIASLRDLDAAMENSADGIGLFRTESLFLNGPPTEQEQFEVYKAVAERMGSKPVTIRTLDIGGDKAAPWMDLPKENNPFLGYRAIRLCLVLKELFQTQLRAILRASGSGNIKIMFPMVCTVDEFRQAKALLEQVKEELRTEYEERKSQGHGEPGKPENQSARKEPFKYEIAVGIMIETPAAALMSDHLAKEADFFSIGTNDLIQYIMAADRLNGKVSGLYSCYQPAVLRLIQMTAENGRKHGIPVGMCGEAAREEKLIPLWAGMGLDELSVNAGSILHVKKTILHTSYERAQKLVSEVLNCAADKEVEELLQKK